LSLPYLLFSQILGLLGQTELLQLLPRKMAPPPEKSLGPWALLLLVPFVALLWVPFYNFSEPHLLGFPFFYWYQFLWVPVTSLLIYIVYLKTR
jgi:Protein of unknown function (DUF3311)